jgi:hypothetical protein
VNFEGQTGLRVRQKTILHTMRSFTQSRAYSGWNSRYFPAAIAIDDCLWQILSSDSSVGMHDNNRYGSAKMSLNIPIAQIVLRKYKSKLNNL